MITASPGDDLRLVAAARACLGVKFKHRGRDPKTGLDCAGLVVHSLHQIGLDPHDLKTYGREPFQDGLVRVVQSNLGPPLPKHSDILPGDILLFRFSRDPHHLGIAGDYIHGGLSLIHAYGGAEKVVEHRFDQIWIDRVCDVYRLPVN